jgi:ribonuclease BN (tRNA processing enzyme)
MSDTEAEEDSSADTLLRGHKPLEGRALADAFLVRFWGVRGSYPVSEGTAQRVGGHTSCVEVQVGGHEIILDAGTGLIPLGQLFRERMKITPPTITILFSHLHYDHILGLPFFDPLYQPGASLHLAGPRLAGKSIADTLCGAITSPYFPVDLREVPASCAFYTLEPGDVLLWHAGDEQPHVHNERVNGASKPLAEDDVRVSFLHTAAHPRNGCLISRVEYRGRRLVYATDVEWGEADNEQLIRFAAGADVLIHDAQYSEEDYLTAKHGFGHSTPHMATEVARAAGVKRLLLFHHDPEHDDGALEQLEDSARRAFSATNLAFEGLEVPLLGMS